MDVGLLLREQAVALALQEVVLLPPRQDVPGLDMATFYNSALEEATIGVDFFDVFPLG